MRTRFLIAFCLTSLVPFAFASGASNEIRFDRDVRPILSNYCFTCHGPDDAERQGGPDGLRLDTEKGMFADMGGYTVIERGNPDESEFIRRLLVDVDSGEIMPPEETGKKLTEAEIESLTAWVRQGAPYARHWSYIKPTRPQLAKVTNGDWVHNAIDHFILARLEQEGLSPSTAADRYALIRRVSLDLTGLPPTIEAVDQFVGDPREDAYERLMDRLLASDAYGEHWARMWLDLARYADSAGYADDPPRTIWFYRDYVIQSLNDNLPFDQFTIEQIAGDLLPNANDRQRIATAFHRNTMTNSEGGTNDEEFRSVAIVDRVNTTMAVWMGTTMTCAQCHNHKYDPISQEEYFRFFAILNNTQDADRRDESPLIQVYSDEQKQQKATWQSEIAQLETLLQTPTPALAAAQREWEQAFTAEPDWTTLRPDLAVSQNGAQATVLDDGSVLIRDGKPTDVTTLEIRPTTDRLTALRLEALPHDSLPAGGPGNGGGNFVVSRVLATLAPPEDARLNGRIVRITVPGKQKILSLAEVQVFSGSDNVASRGAATQSSTGFGGPAGLAIDDNTDGDFAGAKSTTHTEISDDPWWEVELPSAQAIDRLVIWNRTDNELHTRLNNFHVALLDEKRQTVWEQTVDQAPNPNLELALSSVRGISLVAAYADFSQSGFDAANVIDNKDVAARGWAIAPELGRAHRLTLIPAAPVEIPAGSQLTIQIEQLSKHENTTLGHFRLDVTDDVRVAEYAKTPSDILAILQVSAPDRVETQANRLAKYFLGIAPELQPERERLAAIRKQVADQKPLTTLPIMAELPEEKRRKTHVQYRGSFLDLGPEVSPAVPAALHSVAGDAEPDRLALAKWLVDEDNPLTARVIANRYWEQIFGIGIVRTSEEFGSQGDRPSHPELLDWLATELTSSGWDLKHLLKTLVMSSTYRQSSRVSEVALEIDPNNRLLSRGPRFRMSAEMVRDQALLASGLLSSKMSGPPVRPPRPTLGLRAAFGGSTDWKTSEGPDRYRRAVYTEWRRSLPYPSMATFDAPNRQVCMVRRERTNTPLQALVTLNDPVYVEAAQALARRMAGLPGDVGERASFGFRLCLSRHPDAQELDRLVQLFETARNQFQKTPDRATAMATDPLGPLPEGSDAVELAAWTIVGNVLLNLDETLMKR